MAEAPDAQDAAADAWFGEGTVAVVGLGLMGGSLAGALRGGESGPRRCRRVIGIVRRPESIAAATPWVDEATADLVAVAAADAVVVATPPRTIMRLLPEIAGHLRPGVFLTDLGST